VALPGLLERVPPRKLGGKMNKIERLLFAFAGYGLGLAAGLSLHTEWNTIVSVFVGLAIIALGFVSGWRGTKVGDQ